jgi:hypothetical protein
MSSAPSQEAAQASEELPASEIVAVWAGLAATRYLFGGFAACQASSITKRYDGDRSCVTREIL